MSDAIRIRSPAPILPESRRTLGASGTTAIFGFSNERPGTSRHGARMRAALGYPRRMTDPACSSGVCGGAPPPLVGSVLTGTGLTLRQAAQALERGEEPPLSDVQRRIVEDWALHR
jgi:hypothetical protein